MMYKFNEKVSVKALADLRESVGWNRMEREYKNPLMTSYYHIAVYEDDKLIGYIDSVSNGVTDAYIQDLMVCPDYQGKGIGTDLMDKMIELTRLFEKGNIMKKQKVVKEHYVPVFWQKNFTDAEG